MLCVEKLLYTKKIKANPVIAQIAAISCGMMHKEAIVDLDYNEDSKIDVDANFVLNNKDEIIEIQASSEGDSFAKNDFLAMYDLAYMACKEIFALQKQVLSN